MTYGQYDYDSRQVTHQRFCGTEFPPIFMSNGQRAWLTFVSSGTAVKPKLYEGVKVDYTIIDTGMVRQLIPIQMLNRLKG